jgi:hypothetical protein
VGASPSGPSTATFVVRVWLDDSSTIGAAPIWRATLIDVVGDRRRTVDRLDQIVEFLAERLVEMGVHPDDASR